MTLSKNIALALKLLACALLPIIVLILVMSLRSNPSFETASGDSHNWKSDKWTIVNYFAEWCAPCLEELPELNQLAERSDIRVFGISYDSLSVDEIKGLINKYQIEFPILKSSAVQALPLSIPAVLPTTYIVSPDGQVMDALHGKVTEEAIDHLLSNLSK
ncbi:TlpA family protein disulfide reductase [Marinomonas sp. C2222]|uniref:TlpA family protein disulfide reductase n=1 Tax=Marinomonas sargassi TaxID=2984494 RepID=A0ABT2YTQ9_9GAMM|nr:TlpA disulfide reductase family protein [Marinomonas sargassi]MCV2403284.1 TlpA family protein disulfide reductase [Marinomonas sargassi]